MCPDHNLMPCSGDAAFNLVLEAVRVTSAQAVLTTVRIPSRSRTVPSDILLCAAGESKRRFLAYSLLGCVTCRQDADCQVVEVLFHDQRGRQRVPHLSDYFGFTMAALGDKACIFLILNTTQDVYTKHVAAA